MYIRGVFKHKIIDKAKGKSAPVVFLRTILSQQTNERNKEIKKTETRRTRTRTTSSSSSSTTTNAQVDRSSDLEWSSDNGVLEFWIFYCVTRCTVYQDIRNIFTLCAFLAFMTSIYFWLFSVLEEEHIAATSGDVGGPLMSSTKSTKIPVYEDIEVDVL